MFSVSASSQPHNDLEQLKRQARELLRDYRAGRAEAVELVAAHYRDPDVSKFRLSDAQLVLARVAGFESWPKLKASIVRPTSAPANNSTKVYSVPEFVSPSITSEKARGEAVPREAFELVSRYNALQDQLISIEMRGTCARRHDPRDAGHGGVDEWESEKDTACIVYDRAAGRAAIEHTTSSGTDRAEIDGAVLTTSAEGHVSIADQALLLLAFRKFAPAEFRSVDAGQLMRPTPDGTYKPVPVRDVKSASGVQLSFDRSARLLRIQMPVSFIAARSADRIDYLNLRVPHRLGFVTLDLEDFRRVRDGLELPTIITVSVPHVPPVRREHSHDFRFQFHELRLNSRDDAIHVDIDRMLPVTQAVALEIEHDELPVGADRLQIRKTIRNPGEKAVTFGFEFLSGQSSWSFQPPAGQLTIPPRSEAIWQVRAAFDPERPAPRPRVRGWWIGEGHAVTGLVETEAGVWIRRLAFASRVSRPPVLDGRVAPGEYGATRRFSGFANPDNASRPQFDCEFLVTYNDDAIYLAATTFEKDALSRRQIETQRDGEVWQDDSIELFIDVTHERKNYHHFAVNASNVQFDAIGGAAFGVLGDPTWSAEWQSSVKAQEDRFVYELAIPYTSLGVERPQPGEVWGFNLCRNRRAGEGTSVEQSQWTLTWGRYNRVQAFGDLCFE